MTIFFISRAFAEAPALPIRMRKGEDKQESIVRYERTFIEIRNQPASDFSGLNFPFLRVERS